MIQLTEREQEIIYNAYKSTEKENLYNTLVDGLSETLPSMSFEDGMNHLRYILQLKNN